MKKLFNTLQTFRIGLQMEAEPKPRAKVHYLQERLLRLQKLAQLARQDKNIYKSIQAHRLINDLQKKLSTNSNIKLPYIN